MAVTKSILRDYLGLAILCTCLWAFQFQRPLNADVAWLLDAGSRWFAGQKLYVDILELNPPLIFYDMALLTGGTWSKAAFLAGVCAAIFLSCALSGRKWIAFVALSVPALLPFGQREHLALIAVLPYLTSDRRNWTKGILLFLGVALKPHLILIPALAAFWRKELDQAVLTLGGLLLTYLLFIAIIHPEFLTVMVPLARATYGAVGGVPTPDLLFNVALVTMVAMMNWRSPLAGAILGALLSYLLQGKFWYYHLVPAIGLALYLSLVSENRKGLNLACATALTIMAVTYVGRSKTPIDPVPPDATRVLFLTSHIPMAYPVVFERGVENTSPFGALWPVPGAIEKPEILQAVLRRQVDHIVRRCPQYVFTNVREPIDLFKLLKPDPRFGEYHLIGRVHSYRVYRRKGCV